MKMSKEMMEEEDEMVKANLKPKTKKKKKGKAASADVKMAAAMFAKKK